MLFIAVVTFFLHICCHTTLRSLRETANKNAGSQTSIVEYPYVLWHIVCQRFRAKLKLNT